MKKHSFLLFISVQLFFVASAQNVGIGTNTPAYKLDVLGRMRLKTETLNDVNTSSGIWFDDYRNGNNRLLFGMMDSTRGGFYGTGTGVGWNLVFDSKTGIFSNRFNLNGPVYFYDGVTNYAGGRITPDSANLQINARRSNFGFSSGDLILQVNATNGLTTQVAGNVGIGIDSADYKLSLKGDMGFYNGSDFIGFMGNEGADFLINAKTGNTSTSVAPQNLILQASNVASTTTGRVGIGTTSPSGKLHVYGTSGELFRTGTASNAIQMTQDYVQFISNTGAKFFMQLSGNNLTLTNTAANSGGVLTLNGNQVTVGQVTPAVGYKLSVGGKVICEEVKVQLEGNWPDYVFKKDYKLKSFDELRSFIAANSHLPNIPAAAEVEKNGLAVGDMQRRLTEKVEELTLYLLQLEEKIKTLEEKLNAGRK